MNNSNEEPPEKSSKKQTSILMLTFFLLAVVSSLFYSLPSKDVKEITFESNPKPIPTPIIVATPDITQPPNLNVSTINRVPNSYRVYIDEDYGFYRIRSTIPNTDMTLDRINIFVGDKISWINDDSRDFPLTIISKDGLWDNSSGILKYNYRHVDYTFNKTGSYDFMVKESRKNKNMTITVT